MMCSGFVPYRETCESCQFYGVECNGLTRAQLVHWVNLADKGFFSLKTLLRHKDGTPMTIEEFTSYFEEEN